MLPGRLQNACDILWSTWYRYVDGSLLTVLLTFRITANAIEMTKTEATTAGSQIREACCPTEYIERTCQQVALQGGNEQVAQLATTRVVFFVVAWAYSQRFRVLPFEVNVVMLDYYYALT